MSSLPITEPGTRYSPCGKWGCGDHGECGNNNVCACHPGWSGEHCEIAPRSAPNAEIGDFECGNWGVYGTLALGASGYSSHCDCESTGMFGARCERECNTSADCGTGTCDTEWRPEWATSAVGRCTCSQKCNEDEDCSAGTCKSGECSAGWTDVQCQRATSNECSETSGCGEGGTCSNNMCVCDEGYSGYRCENKLAGTGETCNYSSDCKDANVRDVCFEGVCGKSATECLENEHCKVICRDGICTYPTIPPEITEEEMGNLLDQLIDELMTPEGLATLFAEEKLEDAMSKLPAGGAVSYARLVAGRKILAKYKAKYGSTVAPINPVEAIGDEATEVVDGGGAVGADEATEVVDGGGPITDSEDINLEFDGADEATEVVDGGGPITDSEDINLEFDGADEATEVVDGGGAVGADEATEVVDGVVKEGDEVIEKTGKRGFKSSSGRHAVKNSGKQAPKSLATRAAEPIRQVGARTLKRGIARKVTKNTAATAVRNGIKTASTRMMKLAASGPVAILMFAIEVVAMVLDIDDAAGFNARLAQDNVDLFMKKMLALINETPALREVGVQFPREYLPEETLDWRITLGGEVVARAEVHLTEDYISRLDVNSNGATIRRKWTPVVTSAEPSTSVPDHNPFLWSVSDKTEDSYSVLKKWWWILLILGVVVVASIGLAVGLATRARRRVK